MCFTGELAVIQNYDFFSIEYKPLKYKVIFNNQLEIRVP